MLGWGFKRRGDNNGRRVDVDVGVVVECYLQGLKWYNLQDVLFLVGSEKGGCGC